MCLFCCHRKWEAIWDIAGLEKQSNQSEAGNSTAKPRACSSYAPLSPKKPHHVWKSNHFLCKINMQIMLNALMTDCIWIAIALEVWFKQWALLYWNCIQICALSEVKGWGICGIGGDCFIAGMLGACLVSPWRPMFSFSAVHVWLCIKCSSVPLPAGCATCLSLRGLCVPARPPLIQTPRVHSPFKVLKVLWVRDFTVSTHTCTHWEVKQNKTDEDKTEHI